jgi:CheY-like chemotaxis protein
MPEEVREGDFEEGLGYSRVRNSFRPERLLIERIGMSSQTLEGGKESVSKTILVVDDDIITQNLLRSTLSQAGYSVVVASNGEEGISRASEQPPDLIVLDIIMPGMGGGDVAGFLQMNPETQKIPIIFLSSLISENQKKPNSKRDAMIYLSKPYNRDELLNEIRKVFLGGELA